VRVPVVVVRVVVVRVVPVGVVPVRVHVVRGVHGAGARAVVHPLLLARRGAGHRQGGLVRVGVLVVPVRVPVRVAHGGERGKGAARGDHRRDAVDHEPEQRQRQNRPGKDRVEGVRALGTCLRCRVRGLLEDRHGTLTTGAG
jgi:hypothetical protein